MQEVLLHPLQVVRHLVLVLRLAGVPKPNRLSPSHKVVYNIYNIFMKNQLYLFTHSTQGVHSVSIYIDSFIDLTLKELIVPIYS